ncbi:MAG: hypothetical protein COB16_17530 [Rhodobacteraceae bacterium]|nr:MAG: hypothetical protein COB16_17530 [Paracoccaceae bacterium]
MVRSPADLLLYVLRPALAGRAVRPGSSHCPSRWHRSAADRSGHFGTLVYDLTKALGGLTGVPIVLNTSFNIMGKPIIHSVEDALAAFMTSGLDVKLAAHGIPKDNLPKLATSPMRFTICSAGPRLIHQ